jgi:hypothetical protein
MHPDVAIEVARQRMNELHAEAARRRFVSHPRRTARRALTARGWARLRRLAPPSPQPTASTPLRPNTRPTEVRQAVPELS